MVSETDAGLVERLTALSDRVEAASASGQRATLKEAYHAIFPHNSPQHDHQHRARFIGFLDAGGYLDAAMTLRPEGWFTFCAGEDRHSHSWSWELRHAGHKAHARAATPALALTVACLRARGL